MEVSQDLDINDNWEDNEDYEQAMISYQKSRASYKVYIHMYIAYSFKSLLSYREMLELPISPTNSPFLILYCSYSYRETSEM